MLPLANLTSSVGHSPSPVGVSTSMSWHVGSQTVILLGSSNRTCDVPSESSSSSTLPTLPQMSASTSFHLRALCSSTAGRSSPIGATRTVRLTLSLSLSTKSSRACGQLFNKLRLFATRCRNCSRDTPTLDGPASPSDFSRPSMKCWNHSVRPLLPRSSGLGGPSPKGSSSAGRAARLLRLLIRGLRQLVQRGPHDVVPHLD